ncbi:MAG: hypothetical protein ACO3PJ_09150 [Burkholderiaceae bacterium]|jgi:hypothetical protein
MDNKFELPREGVRIYDPKSGWQASTNKPGAAIGEESRFEPSEHDTGESPNEPSDQEGHDHLEDEAHENEEALEERELDQQEANERMEEQHDAGLHEAHAYDASHTSDHDEVLDPRDDDHPKRYSEAHFQSQSQSQTHSPEAFAAEALRSLSDNLSSAGALAGYSGPSRGKSATGLVPQGQAAALAKVGDSLDGLFTVIQRSTLANSVDGSAPSWRDVANISRHLEGRLNTRQELLKELTKVDREIRDTRDDLLVTLKALSEFEQQNLQAASMRASISSVAARVIAKRFEESGGD